MVKVLKVALDVECDGDAVASSLNLIKGAVRATPIAVKWEWTQNSSSVCDAVVLNAVGATASLAACKIAKMAGANVVGIVRNPKKANLL